MSFKNVILFCNKDDTFIYIPVIFGEFIFDIACADMVDNLKELIGYLMCLFGGGQCNNQ